MKKQYHLSMESRDNISVIESYFIEAQNNFYSTLESNPEFSSSKMFLEYFEQEINKILKSYQEKNKKQSIKDIKKEKRIKVKKSLISSLRKLSTAMFESGESNVVLSEKDVLNSYLVLIDSKLKTNIKAPHKQSHILPKPQNKPDEPLAPSSLQESLSTVVLSKKDKNKCFEMYQKSFDEHINKIRDKKERGMSKSQIEKLTEDRNRMYSSVAWLGSSYYTPDYLKEIDEAIDLIKEDVDKGKYPTMLKVYCEEERKKYYK